MPTKRPAPLDGTREALRCLLGNGCFIRRSVRDTFLFTSDYPRRGGDPEALAAKDSAGRFLFEVCPDGLLHADLSRAAWLDLIAHALPYSERASESVTVYPFLFSAARRLACSDTPPDMDSTDVLRMVLKHLDAGEIALLEDRLPPIVAGFLRKKAPLPRAAGLLILNHLWPGD